MTLAGRVAVVTGASRGIGAATAGALRGAGATVVRLARSLEDRRADGGLDLRCDLADAGALARAAGRILHELGTPDLLVSCAGAFALAPFEETTPEVFEEQLRQNLRVPFAVARAFVPAMRAAGRGLVVHVGSIADHLALPGNTAYAAAKFGLRGLHETLAAEYRGTGLRFTLISPGPTDTALWDPVDPDRREGFIRRADMLRPDDVAEAILFVATRAPRVHVDWLRLGPA